MPAAQTIKSADNVLPLAVRNVFGRTSVTCSPTLSSMPSFFSRTAVSVDTRSGNADRIRGPDSITVCQYPCWVPAHGCHMQPASALSDGVQRITQPPLRRRLQWQFECAPRFPMRGCSYAYAPACTLRSDGGGNAPPERWCQARWFSRFYPAQYILPTGIQNHASAPARHIQADGRMDPYCPQPLHAAAVSRRVRDSGRQVRFWLFCVFQAGCPAVASSSPPAPPPIMRI